MLLGRFIQSVCVRIEQHRHLVDKRARAAGAGSVHSLFDGLAIERDLGVLSAELDGCIRFRDQRLHGLAAGDYLLFERHLDKLGNAETA